MKYILYGNSFARSLVTEMVMAEGQIEYELHEVDMFKQEHRLKQYLAINPAGWLPALVCPSGEVLYETPAINLYLCEKHQLKHLAPASEEGERGKFLSGLFYITDELEPATKRFYYPHRYIFQKEDLQKMKHQALEDTLKCFAVINHRLQAEGPYHLGKRFSLVDITMAYWAMLMDFGDNLLSYPGVKQCMDLVAARPRLESIFKHIQKAGLEYAQLQVQGKGVE